MSFLTPCPGCGRHVMNDEAACPFCAQPLELAGVPAPPVPRQRLGRAATFAFGATLLGATALTACGDDENSDDDAVGGSGNLAGQQAIYGAPAPAAGSGGRAAAGAGPGPIGGGAAVPMYGVPAVPEAGTGGRSQGAGGFHTLYGLPPQSQ